MASFFKSIRNRLILLVLLIIFPVIAAVLFYALSEQRREARVQAQDSALRIARLAAREQERLIAGTQHLLMTLAELPEVRERKPAECSKLFAAMMKRFPHYTNIAAVTPQGDIFCSGLPGYDRSPNIADRAYFQVARDERRLGISHVLVGRMSGKPNISIAYPSFDANGPVHAVVFVGLDLGWLNSMAASAQMPPEATLAAFDDNGRLFVRFPHTEHWTGKTVTNPVFKAVVERREGITQARGLDGVERLYGFTTLYQSSKSGALFVSVGIPVDVAFASSTRIFYVSIVAIFLASLLAAAATGIGAHFFVRRRLEKLLDAARSLGEVDLIEGAPRSPGKSADKLHPTDPIIEQMGRSLQNVTGRQADLAAMIAHDLRNPVQTIDCAASLLPESAESKEQERALTDMIRRSCKDLSDLINRFLDFSKFRAGYLDLATQEFDVMDFLRDIYRRYSLRCQQKRIILKFAGQARDGFSISADRKKMEQLMENLLGNALKFTAEGGQIEIGAERDGDGTHIWVRDTGIGIGAEEMKTLFTKYRQASSAKKTDTQGTGLGLMICKMIAEGHGGRIWAESVSNKGTTVHVWIPDIAASYSATGTDR